MVTYQGNRIMMHSRKITGSQDIQRTNGVERRFFEHGKYWVWVIGSADSLIIC